MPRDGPPTGTPERRRLRRYVRRIPVRFLAGTLRAQGHVKNLSQEGLFIRSHVLPRPGDEVVVAFTSPQGLKIEIAGFVRWTTEQFPSAKTVPPGFGVRLHRVDDTFLRFFEEILLS